MPSSNTSIGALAAAFAVGALLGAGIAYNSGAAKVRAVQARLDTANHAVDDLKSQLAASAASTDRLGNVRAAPKKGQVPAVLPAVVPVTVEDPEIGAAKELIRARLKDPSSVIFGDVVIKVDRSGKRYACGFFNARNSFGGYSGMGPFVVDLADKDAHEVTEKGGTDPLGSLMWIAYCKN